MWGQVGHNAGVERRAKLLVGHLAAVAVIAVAAGYWWLRAEAPAPGEGTSAAPPTEVPTAAAPPEDRKSVV